MIYSELLFFLGVMPITVLMSFLDKSTEYKNLILVLTSVAFVSWGKPLWCLLIFATVISEYFIGLGIGKTRINSKPVSSLLLAADLGINVFVFLLLGHNALFSQDSALHLRAAVIPIGAAWYTAKGFSYCFDVYTGRCREEKNIFCLLTYMVSYHFLMAGPVVRYGDTEPYIRKRTVTGKCVNDGLVRFIVGLGKGVILAPAFGRIAQAGLEHKDTTLAGSWVGMFAFFGECWFSFTAFCDMAKGLGLMNGFNYEENYRDLSVSGMLGGLVKSANTTLIKLVEDFFKMFTKGNVFFGAVCTLFGCVIVALWYSISKPFAIVGAALGAVLMIEHLIPEKTRSKIPIAVKAVYVGLLATLIIGGLRFTALEDYKNWLQSLFGVGNDYILTKALRSALLENLFLIIIAFCYVCVPVKKLIASGIRKLEAYSVTALALVRVSKTALTALLLVMCVITLAAQKV
ncbi:MAG: acyltransferase [Ruminococcus sp.]|nr:acyltransferase [Ruminococcus sp.]